MYGGTSPSIQVGSLLTVPQAVLPALRSGLKTVVGGRFLQAIVTYGAYLVDDAAGYQDTNGWGNTNINYEQGVAEEVMELYNISINAQYGTPAPRPHLLCCRDHPDAPRCVDKYPASIGLATLLFIWISCTYLN